MLDIYRYTWGNRKGCQKIQVFINETILMEMSILNQTQVVKSKSLSPQGMLLFCNRTSPLPLHSNDVWSHSKIENQS